MDLTQLTDAPELTVSIGGRDYHFSELTLEHLGRLQAYLRRATLDPWEHARQRCQGLPEGVQAAILDSARKESLRWPPQVGTAEGAQALLGTEAGQVEALCEGLSIHQPGTTREQAARVFRQMRREPDSAGVARRVFAVLFGLPPDRGEEPLPKA